MDARSVAIEKKQNHDENNEKQVNDQGGEDFDDGKDADAESYFLYHEGILRYRDHAVVDGVAEKIPDDHACDIPEDVREILHRLGSKTYLENEPEDEDVRNGKEECPNDAEVGAEVVRLEVPLCQLIDNILFFAEFLDEIREHFYALH